MPTTSVPETQPAPRQTRWTRDRHQLWLVLLLAFALLVVLRPSIRGHDGVLNYAYARSLLLDRDLDFTNDYSWYISREASWFDNKDLPRDPVTNLPINLYGVGSSLLWSPFLLAAHGFALTGSELGLPVTADGFSQPYAVAVGFASCLYASLGMVLTYLVMRRNFGCTRAFWGCLGVWLASPLFFYMYLHPSMSHANTFFLAALLLWLYQRPDTFRKWALLGLVTGLLTLTRFQDLILVSSVIAAEAWQLRDPEFRRGLIRHRLPRYLLATAVALLAFSPQLAAWHYLQGSAFSGPRAYIMQGNINPLAPRHALDVLFSPRHGVFYWHPFLLVCVAGLFLPRGSIHLRLACLVAFFAQLWVVSSWSIWWAGASFGHRMFISTLPFLAAGAAAAMGRIHVPAWRRLVLASLIAWNFGYIVQYGSGMISRQEGVPLSELVRNNLVRVPQLLFGRGAGN